MIKHTTARRGIKRTFFYNDVWIGSAQLHKLPECVVSLSVLTQRLTQAVTNPKNCRWKTVNQCLVTPVIVGRQNNRKKINLNTKPKEKDEFLKLMISMPIYKGN